MSVQSTLSAPVAVDKNAATTGTLAAALFRAHAHAARLALAALALCALLGASGCRSMNEQELMEVPDRSARIQKLPRLDPVFLETGSKTSQAQHSERALFLSEVRKNLVAASGETNGYLILSVSSTRDKSFTGWMVLNIFTGMVIPILGGPMETWSFESDLTLRVLDKYGNEIRQYNAKDSSTKCLSLIPWFWSYGMWAWSGVQRNGSLLVFKNAFEKIVRQLPADTAQIAAALSTQRGTPEQAEAFANLIVEQKIDATQLAQIARVNKSNQEAADRAREQEALSALATVGSTMVTAGSMVQQHQYNKDMRKWNQKVAQTTGGSQGGSGGGSTTQYWAGKTIDAKIKLAGSEAVVSVKKDLNTATGGLIKGPTQTDMFLRNSDRKMARIKQDALASSQRADARRAAAAQKRQEAAVRSVLAERPIAPIVPPIVLVPVPQTAVPVYQTAPEYKQPVASAGHKARDATAPATPLDNTAEAAVTATPVTFDPANEGGTAAAAALFRQGLTYTIGEKVANNFDSADSRAELAREYNYRTATSDDYEKHPDTDEPLGNIGIDRAYTLRADGKDFSFDHTKDDWYPQAFALFSNAAKQGSRPAMFHLALMHKYGRGTPQNNTAAEKWLTTAATAGYEPAIQLKKINKNNPAQ
ncbi:MAG: hypothetical protein LBT53_02120 [Puniceicoccales bacterium]|jgi:TPR repeat protein|nr:hypothetical protein [Puniceicoccales bacterium]